MHTYLSIAEKRAVVSLQHTLHHLGRTDVVDLFLSEGRSEHRIEGELFNSFRTTRFRIRQSNHTLLRKHLGSPIKTRREITKAQHEKVLRTLDFHFLFHCHLVVELVRPP